MAKTSSSMAAIEQTRTPLGPGSEIVWLDNAGRRQS